EIAATIPNIEYDPTQFPGLVYRLKKPKTATLIFNTGKMVCTGGKSEKDSRRAVMKIVKGLNQAGIKVSGKPEITILMSRALVSQKDAGLLRKVIFVKIRRTLMGLIQVPSSLDCCDMSF
ncbi:unnamed protein product, partial [marine sediment metagenome]